MDLGSLELQIFVSLTVVLGAAFVALVCDYLKGNNEQLREHNIELRVRREEQERRLLLDPAGYVAQYAASGPVAVPLAAKAPVPAEAVMKSYADPATLRDAAKRAETLSARYAGGFDEEEAEIPDVSARRKRRSRPRPEPESDHTDWVRPEVLARVARKADASAAYHADIREEISAPKPEVNPAPLNAPEKWDIREKIVPTAPVAKQAEPEPVPVPPQAPVVDAPPAEVVALQQEIERVASQEPQIPSQPAGVLLRPLVVPALRLEEELARVSEPEEERLASQGPLHSALLEEVIAASAIKPEVEPAISAFAVTETLQTVSLPAPAAEEPVLIEAAMEPELVVAELPADTSRVEVEEPSAPLVAEEPVYLETSVSFEAEPAPALEETVPVESAEAEPPMQELVPQFQWMTASPSELYGMGVSQDVEMIAGPAVPEMPLAQLALQVVEPIEEQPPFEAATELLPAFADLSEPDAPLEVISFANEAFPLPMPEPPPVWADEPAAAEPIDISTIRPVEPAPEPVAMELPNGMHDYSTWSRLLALSEPMSGILFTITLTKAEAQPAEKGKKPVELPDLTVEMNRLMNSFLRETDFGCQIGENEWVFVYRPDATGFNQRRVGGISEKLWDFQLRHLGMSTVSFKWGAVEVQDEKLADALTAARERMNQAPRKNRRLPGPDLSGTRKVVNA